MVELPRQSFLQSPNLSFCRFIYWRLFDSLKQKHTYLKLTLYVLKITNSKFTQTAILFWWILLSKAMSPGAFPSASAYWRAKSTLSLWSFLILAWIFSTHSSLILLLLRVTPKSSFVLPSTSHSFYSTSSSTRFMQKLKCLNYRFLMVTHIFTVSPLSFFLVIYSILSSTGTTSSGFLEAFSFLFFSMIKSLYLSAARWLST